MTNCAKAAASSNNIARGRCSVTFESGKPQWSTVARTEVKYLNMQGNPVAAQDAVRVITTEYDENGTIICTHLRLNFGQGEKE